MLVEYYKRFCKSRVYAYCNIMDRDDKVIEVKKGGIIYSKTGKLFINLKFDSRKKEYTYMGITMFYPINIPQEYRQHEFLEFYQENFSPKFYPEGIENEISIIMLDQFWRIIFGKTLINDEN